MHERPLGLQEEVAGIEGVSLREGLLGHKYQDPERPLYY